MYLLMIHPRDMEFLQRQCYANCKILSKDRGYKRIKKPQKVDILCRIGTDKYP